MKVTTFHGSLRCELCRGRMLIAVKIAHTANVMFLCRDCAHFLNLALIEQGHGNVR